MTETRPAPWGETTVVGKPPQEDCHMGSAVERIFLQRVGGGYIFVHRMLLEFFATLGEGQSGFPQHPGTEFSNDVYVLREI